MLNHYLSDPTLYILVKLAVLALAILLWWVVAAPIAI